MCVLLSRSRAAAVCFVQSESSSDSYTFDSYTSVQQLVPTSVYCSVV
jgi:hypothetical protein